MAASSDGGTPDLARDQAVPDGATPDQAVADQATPDDAPSDDGAMPDQATPDGAPPDLALPDQAAPDLGAPPPDLARDFFVGDAGLRAVTFTPVRSNLAGFVNGPNFLSVGRFRNANYDVAISDGGGVAHVLLGNNNGTFSDVLLPATGTGPAGVFAADVNLDQHLDVVVANGGANTVSVVFGNGDGTFQLQPQTSQTAVGTPLFVAAAQLDNAGGLDLVVDYGGIASFSAFLSGANNMPARTEYANMVTSPRGMLLTDLDGDGRPDLAIASYGGQTLSVFKGRGDGTFMTPPSTPTAAPITNGPYHVAAGDFNGDGRIDLAVADDNQANNVTGNVGILLNNGNLVFQPAVLYPTGGRTQGVTVGDFNLDGSLDVAASNRADGNVAVLLGRGDGTFQQPPALFALGGNPQPIDIGTGDFNLDGKPDLVTANGPEHTVTVLLNTTP